VVTTKAITSSPILNEISTTSFDGLARASQTQINSDDPSATYALTTYDSLGRKSRVYNPARCNPITSNCGETSWGYTTYNYDPLNRTMSVVGQDGSTVSYSYSGNCTTVTDEATKSRKSCTDGLGRISGVWEDPGTSPHLNYETDYTYDALGNLKNVNQQGSNVANARTRSFTYDSLSRLTQAQNPESGTISYSYDANGNLTSRTAPSPNQPASGTAQVTTTYTYDALNRLTGKSYADAYTSNAPTPSVKYGYDGATLTGCTTAPPTLADTYPIGRRTAMCDGSGAISWAHDPMGRVSQQSHTIASVAAKIVSYNYNLDGSLLNYTTSPLKTVTYTYNAAGRMTAAKDNGDTPPINFVTGASYAPFGGLSAMSYAQSSSPIALSNTYNNRLQPLNMSAQTGSGTALMNLTYNFNLGNGTTGSDNGNVISITNGLVSNRSQNFTYDLLNRIATAYSTGTNWGETYTIDAWGNLTNIAPYTGKTNSEPLGCAPANIKNRLNTCFTYDAAGNLILNSPNTYTYDAENRLIATGGQNYLYDGDGNRVAKCGVSTCAVGTAGTFYWRNVAGDTLIESNTAGTFLNQYVFFNGQRVARRDLSANLVHYYFSDHLGSHSLVTNADGTHCEQDTDYYPYGGQLNEHCTTPVAQNYKFTGKERDAESGLDEFGARYYASSLGRFMIPDWSESPTSVPYASLPYPQSLNLYSIRPEQPT
jgi:RHS repeat-associated protein